jgi:hypothetical protein
MLEGGERATDTSPNNLELDPLGRLMYNEYLPVKTWYFQADPLPWFRAKSPMTALLPAALVGAARS